jgi:hypothetical protein
VKVEILSAPSGDRGNGLRVRLSGASHVGLSQNWTTNPKAENKFDLVAVVPSIVSADAEINPKLPPIPIAHTKRGRTYFLATPPENKCVPFIIERFIAYVGVSIDTAAHPNWVDLNVSSGIRVVIPEVVVVQSRFLIEVLPGKSLGRLEPDRHRLH